MRDGDGHVTEMMFVWVVLGVGEVHAMTERNYNAVSVNIRHRTEGEKLSHFVEIYCSFSFDGNQRIIRVDVRVYSRSLEFTEQNDKPAKHERS